METDNFKAVLFDLDGTLIDTEKYYHICWPAAVEHFGYAMPAEQHLDVRSLGRPYAKEKFRQWYGDDFDYDTVREYRKSIFNELVSKHGIQTRPGAFELLDFLRANGYMTAVATATDLQRTKEYLKLTGLEGKFDVLCSAADMKRGKPAPDIYSYACEQIGLRPDECVAVEDSPNGVISAYIAGVRVIYVPDLVDDERQIRNYIYAKASSLADIIELLK